MPGLLCWLIITGRLLACRPLSSQQCLGGFSFLLPLFVEAVGQAFDYRCYNHPPFHPAAIPSVPGSKSLLTHDAIAVPVPF